MAKRGKLSKAERFYIEQKMVEVDVETLAKDLDRTPNIVRKHIDSVPVPEVTPEQPQPHVTEPAPEEKSEDAPFVPRAMDQMVTTTRDQQRGGVVGMTQNASMMADEGHSKTLAKAGTMSKRHADAIAPINPDKPVRKGG